MVALNPEELGAVVNRLRRAQGQIGGVLRMIEQGRRPVLNVSFEHSPHHGEHRP